ncbi:TPA: nucleotide exchange factor GrpE [candidate division WOR-3 bacterium]|jgi:molecular chaperone GrpE|uniref:Protein GrpE n=1 Tax=candidate division WOR-3 bacterium TaxID=2052148 RepID=A0A350H9S3_UNCW3|nr:nucleotide exchange factor GrpE [candidate division WOR-3 bacterium]
MSKKRRIANKEIKLLDRDKKQTSLIASESFNLKQIEEQCQSVKMALEEKQRELKEQKEMFLRKLAECENSKKILKKETDLLLENANTRVLKEVLLVVDNFDRAIDAASLTEEKDKIIEGIRMIDKQFHQAFEKLGVKVYESKGERFDPSKHEAISVKTDAKMGDGVVLEEHQRGYMYQGKILRPAKVIVNKIDSENKEEIND